MIKTSLVDLMLWEAREGLKAKEFSAKELTIAHLQQMDKLRFLNAFVTETSEEALSQAQESDQRLEQGQEGLLEGLPLAIKDLFCTKGVPTTASSNMLRNFVPPYESTVTQNLWNAGAVLLGKTNMDEFAMGSATLNSAFGPTLNPWRDPTEPNRPLVAGGSSGGSVSAVASYMALAATGSDTGGSIRQPASFCGLVGIKPTYGLCSRYGMIAFASSLDQAGPVTRCVRDAALMLKVMASHDEKDSTSLLYTAPDYEAQLTSSVKGLRIGIPKEYKENLSPDVADLLQKGMEWFQAQGATIVDVSLPTTAQALPTYYIIAPAEASSNLARYDGMRYGFRALGDSLGEVYAKTRQEGFGAEVKRRIMIGTYALSTGYYEAYYGRAQKVRTLITQDFNRVFSEVDLLLTPTTPTDAFPIDEKQTDPLTMYLNDIFTVTVNLAGLPAISVPAGLSKVGLPLGLQLIGPAFSEQRLLNAALVLEEAADFETLRQNHLDLPSLSFTNTNLER